jgi:hypothetical protein
MSRPSKGDTSETRGAVALEGSERMEAWRERASSRRCVRSCDEYGAGDGREHAGLSSPTTRPDVLLCAAKVILPSSSTGKTSRPATFRILAAARAGGNFDDRVDDVRGGDRLEAVAGSRTVAASEVQDKTASMNSKNWVARTMEYGVGPCRSSSSCRGLAR